MEYTEKLLGSLNLTIKKETKLIIKVFVLMLIIGLVASLIINTFNYFVTKKVNNITAYNNQLAVHYNEKAIDLAFVKNRLTNTEKELETALARLDTNTETMISAFIDTAETFEATAYTAGHESTGKTPSHPAYGITYSGEPVKKWHTIAADPDVLPIGTKVFIPEFADKPNKGIFVVEDTGRRDGSVSNTGNYKHIQGNRIDIYHPDLAWANSFGRKSLTVIRLDVIYEMVGGKLDG